MDMQHIGKLSGKDCNTWAQECNNRLNGVEQLQWRRDKVQELCSKGYSQREISQTLQVGLATVNRDISYLRWFVSSHISKERLNQSFSSSNTNESADREESNEPDYNEDDDQLEEEVGEITNNQVF